MTDADARLSPPCWLIERSHEPKWWTGGGAHGFTSDVSAAVRFNRRVDAERIINLGFIVDPAAFVSEHLWGDTTPDMASDARLSPPARQLVALEKDLRESLRCGYLFGNFDEPLDAAGLRIVRVIQQRISDLPCECTDRTPDRARCRACGGRL